ncbi:MAG: glycosyltransferase family 2 protein [Acidobacteria bacterium]|nr:glycosyltransferase family 2 protein [Acidobacteriota bacterium]
MAKSLTFSVGIPTFNQAEFLEETILSLLNQRRPPDEIVISDHFSTDHTPDIIAKYAREVRGVKPPTGSNVGAQWEFTLSCLKGDWVTLFSSDDIAHPNFVEVLLRGASRRDDAVHVRAGWENIDANGKALSKHYLLSVKQVSLPPENLLEQRHGPKASFAAFAVHRETLHASGGYPLGMESYGDWPMFAQLAPYGSFIYENEIIAGYRVGHDGNKLRRRIGMWVRDEQRMFYEVLPLAAERARMADRAWIDHASRDNFLRYLASASREFQPSERGEITPLFEPWAARVGGEEQLQLFAQGSRISSPATPLQRAKNFVRPLAQNLNARLRGQ